MFYVVATRKMVIVIQRAEETGKAARGHGGMAWRTPATLTPLAVPLDGGHNHLCHIVGKKMELDQAICFTDGNTETFPGFDIVTLCTKCPVGPSYAMTPGH